MENGYQKYEKFHLWEYARELKQKGLVRNYGFSFHGGPKLLDRLLTEHPDVDFVQLQINYADWESPHVASRANYEVARRHGKPIVIMEPVKGGALANPPRKVRELLQSAAPGASCSSWAIRFAASLEGVMTVLSGMSNVEQMKDNLSYMGQFKPLDEGERQVLRKAQALMGNSAVIPCTACGYCTGCCPQQIPIPEIFSAMNLRLGDGRPEQSQTAYEKATSGGKRASDCVACGQCEQVCPQHIKIADRLKECAAAPE